MPCGGVRGVPRNVTGVAPARRLAAAPAELLPGRGLEQCRVEAGEMTLEYFILIFHREYEVYNGGAQGEAGVNASTTPAIEFVTFAQTLTGVAYANPSN
jgi:hypothetical protein